MHPFLDHAMFSLSSSHILETSIVLSDDCLDLRPVAANPRKVGLSIDVLVVQSVGTELTTPELAYGPKIQGEGENLPAFVQLQLQQCR